MPLGVAGVWCPAPGWASASPAMPCPRVVLVSAPAGFGKTTLITEWLAADGFTKPTAWLSLDRRDSDPAVFWSYVAAALRKVAADVGTDALSTLQSTPMELEAVVTSLLNDLAALDDDVMFVLDDYHLVESLDVQASMLFLVEHLPSQLHLVVARGRRAPVRGRRRIVPAGRVPGRRPRLLPRARRHPGRPRPPGRGPAHPHRRPRARPLERATARHRRHAPRAERAPLRAQRAGCGRRTSCGPAST